MSNIPRGRSKGHRNTVQPGKRTPAFNEESGEKLRAARGAEDVFFQLPHGADWEQRIEQQLTRIETELAAIRSMLTRPGN